MKANYMVLRGKEVEVSYLELRRRYIDQYEGSGKGHESLMIMAQVADTDEQIMDLAHWFYLLTSQVGRRRVVEAMGAGKALKFEKYLPPRTFSVDVIPVLIDLASEKETSFADLVKMTELVSGYDLVVIVSQMMERAETLEDWEAVYSIAETGSFHEREAAARLRQLSRPPNSCFID